MLILKIFQIRSLLQDAREASGDPVGFGSRLVIKKARGGAVLALIVILLLLIATFIFGYTSLIAGPYGIVKFFFWLFLIPSFLLIPFLIYAIRVSNGALKKFPKQVPAKEAQSVLE